MWFVLVVAALAGGVGAAVFARNRAAAPTSAPAPPLVPVEVARVEQATIARTLEVSGTVVPARSAEVVPKISGRVARVLVQDGDRVAAGQPLVELDATDQRNELAQALAALAAAEARLAALERGQRPQERQVVFNALMQAQNQLKAAEAQLVLARATLRVAEDNLRRHEQLLRDGAVSQAQVDQVRLQYDQARAQADAAHTQVEIARSAVDSARQQWELSQAGAREEDLRAARAQVAQARAVAAVARQRLASMTIRAPFAGRVSGVTVSVGDYVVSGDFAGRSGIVAQVYDERTLDVEVRIGERDIGLLRLGQPAVVRLEGAGGATAEAAVRVISPAADAASRSAVVRLRLASGAPRVAPGTFARGEIVVERRAGVLLVPRAAVVAGEPPTVRVVVDGTVQVRPVTLGFTEGDRIEVRRGLSLNEEVVVLGPESLPAGTRVRVVNR
jgi:RND family efflux transporter MFP subunit